MLLLGIMLIKYYISVLGYKMVPLLILIIYFSPFSLIYIFANLLLYSEDILSYMILNLSFLFSLFNFSYYSIYFSFFLMSIGSLSILVSLKIYFYGSMIIGNFIDIYFFGLIVMMINWFMGMFCFGWLLYSFLFYLFLHRLEMFLLILCLLESFSSFFQSLTLSNRLSINLLSGSLLMELLSMAMSWFLEYFFFWLFMLWLIFTFEMLNSIIQLLIFSLLFMEYSIN